jgi:hypothetical protein
VTLEPDVPGAEAALPARPIPIAMYPADVVDGYIRRAEATIARLEKDLAEARDRASRAILALTGDMPSDDVASQNGEAVLARPEVLRSDPLGGFLSALHARVSEPAPEDAPARTRSDDGRGTGGWSE